MPRAKKIVGPDDFAWVRSIYGKGPEAHKRYHYIPEDGMNKIIKDWQEKQPERGMWASPSGILTCPRVIWLKHNKVPIINGMTWAVKQRLMLGRAFEDVFAMQLADEGMLLKHWADNPGQEVETFAMGSGETQNKGVPDYLLDMNGIIAVSDAKTGRSDSYGYVGISDDELFEAWNYYKYRIQLTNYFLLCHKNKDWFEKNNLPLPTHCHLFSYALDDGVVRREVMWKPTQEDMQTVLDMTIRYNKALTSKEAPACTCKESYDGFDVKFCDYGIREAGSKVADSCCGDELINNIKEK